MSTQVVSMKTYKSTCPRCLSGLVAPGSAEPQQLSCGVCAHEFVSSPTQQPKVKAPKVPTPPKEKLGMANRVALAVIVLALAPAALLIALVLKALGDGAGPTEGKAADTIAAWSVVVMFLVFAGFAFVGIVKAIDRRAKGTRFEKAWPFWALFFVVFPFLLPIALLWFLFEWTFYRHRFIPPPLKEPKPMA
jgi:hypothetical protein